MKFTPALLSLAALFSVASATPTPSSNVATIRYNSKYDNPTSSEFACLTVTDNVSTTKSSTTKSSTTKRGSSSSVSPIVIGGASPNAAFSCGSCLQVTLEKTDVFITVVEDVDTEIDIIEVSSDVMTEFITVSDEETVDIETVTLEVVVFEVDEKYCIY